MDINAEIQKATDAFVADKLPAMVEEKVGKMMDNVLGDIFGNYSEMSKGIKAVIEKKLDINLQKFDMVDYNAMVGAAINTRLIGLVNEQAIKPILKLVENTVGFLEKKEIQLSEIHAMVMEAAKEDDSSDRWQGGISFFVEENTEHKWYEVSIDVEQKKEIKQCGMRFLFGESGSIFMFNTGNYFSPTTPITPAKIISLSNLEHKIFRLYSAGVKIIVDQVEFDNSWDKSYD